MKYVYEKIDRIDKSLSAEVKLKFVVKNSINKLNINFSANLNSNSTFYIIFLHFTLNFLELS